MHPITKLLDEIRDTRTLMDKCVDEAVKSKHWCFEIAQALIPWRNAVYDLDQRAESILEEIRGV